MARGQDESNSLRLGRRESGRLIAALLLSLFLHLMLWAGYHTGNRLGWWQGWHLPFAKKPPAKQQQQPVPPPVAQKEDEPETFVDVSQADADAPVKPKYYSNRNSHAANPDVGNQNQVKINGHQTDIIKTEDVPRPLKRTEKATTVADKENAEGSPKSANVPDLAKLQPNIPAPTPPPLVPNQQPNTPQTPGETDLPQPKTTPEPPNPASAPSQPTRPRTIKQALAQRDQIPGPMTQQEGGVPRHAFTSTLDAKATPFGDYDAAIIEAISQRWYDLLDKQRFAQDRTGKVTLRFKLKSDGSVIEMQTLENTVGDLLAYLCQESIEEAAPFAKWPPDMVRMIGNNYREVTFTFYYY